MDLFLKSLSDEVCDLTQSAAKAEQSHSQLQDEYIDLKLHTRNQLIQSSLGLHIPSLKSSRDTSKSFKNKSEDSKVHNSNMVSNGIKPISKTQAIRKSKIRSKTQKKIYNNRNESMPALNRPYKTQSLSSTLNPVRPQTAIQNKLSQDNKEINSGTSQFVKTLNINIDQFRQNQQQQVSSRSKQELKFTQRSLNLNSSRLTVPAHPFIISPALGGEGFDYQDYNHFTEIPPVQNERKTRLKAKSPFFARVFSETANPNCPPDSPLRRPKQEKIDYNIHVF